MEANEIIKKLGGTKKAAELCGVSKGAVSQWRHNGVPRGHYNFIKAVRPDVFDDPLSPVPVSAAENNAVTQGVSA